MELISLLNDFERGRISNYYDCGYVILYLINNIKDNDLARIHYLYYFINLVEHIKTTVIVEKRDNYLLQVFDLTKLDSLIINSFNKLDPLYLNAYLIMKNPYDNEIIINDIINNYNDKEKKLFINKALDLKSLINKDNLEVLKRISESINKLFTKKRCLKNIYLTK